MIRPTLLALLAVAGATVPQPARAEFFTLEQMRAMCRGEDDRAAEFRTGAGYRLLAQVARERCRMYLLGLAEGQLRRIEFEGRERCLPAGTTDAQVADALVAALADRPEQARASVDEVVQDALRSRYGCL